ncbi:MAG: RagB/SusD family nutrient uptake outer membrane protein, partial [Bacteroidia bacterium]|nr:RagB/SusD family nutrient uptake outer membrane protein [Bacteroidia bacterium]
QAYFLRAYLHFTLFRLWGPFPYIDYVIGLDDQWDLERMGNNDYLNRIVADIDSAYDCFVLCDKVRRDPMPGVAGSLNYSGFEMYRPNGMACKAFKSRVLLYAASPFNNKNGTADWEKAAIAAWDAITVAESKGVIILPLTDLVSGIDRHLNYYGKDVCEESIWTRTMGGQSWNWGGGSGSVATIFNGVMMAHTSSSGIHPTQNWVDRYETITGRPLVTEADRAAATTAGEYNEQNPFIGRDPRLATDVIYNGSPCQGWGAASGPTKNTALIYMNADGTPSELLVTSWPGRSYTGYIIRKIWANGSTKNQYSGTIIFSDPLFRLTELYLNYGEAANEAYGPTGSAPLATYTAIGAIDYIRSKRGMPPVRAEYRGTTADLRPRIKNERCVEMGFEAQAYYDDIRRWMDLPNVMRSKLIGNIPNKVTVSPTYPTGFQYVRAELPIDRQTAWEEGMYYLPFLNADALKMKKFVPNTIW